MLKKIATSLFGTRHAREMKRVQPIVDAINQEYERLHSVSEEELRSQILITYQSTTNRTDPGFRVVDLRVVRPGMEAKTMRGYYP